MQEIGEDPEEAKRIARNNYMKFYRSLRSSLHILKVHHQICPVTTHTKSSQWGGFAYCYGYLVPNYTHIYDYIWISKYMKIYFQIYIYIPLCVCVFAPLPCPRFQLSRICASGGTGFLPQCFGCGRYYFNDVYFTPIVFWISYDGHSQMKCFFLRWS